MRRSYTSLLPYAFTARCLIKQWTFAPYPWCEVNIKKLGIPCVRYSTIWGVHIICLSYSHIRWRWVVSHSDHFNPEIEALLTTELDDEWAHFEEERNILLLPWIEPSFLDTATFGLVTIPTVSVFPSMKSNVTQPKHDRSLCWNNVTFSR